MGQFPDIYKQLACIQKSELSTCSQTVGGSVALYSVQTARRSLEKEQEEGSRPRMPVCPPSPSWALVTFKCLFRRRPAVGFRKASYHTHRLLQIKSEFSSVFNRYTTPEKGPPTSSTFGSIFDARMSRKIDMSSAVMSQRMVWVDLEASHRVLTDLWLCRINATVCILNVLPLANATLSWLGVKETLRKPMSGG